MIRIILTAVCVCLALSARADPVAVQMLNDLRGAENRPPVIWSKRLADAAQVHANDMARADFFSHTGSDASQVGDRVTRAGYGWCLVAENIAKGHRSLTEVMSAWAASPGHLQNMLRPGVTEFAVVEGPDAIWVMVLASRTC